LRRLTAPPYTASPAAGKALVAPLLGGLEGLIHHPLHVAQIHRLNAFRQCEQRGALRPALNAGGFPGDAPIVGGAQDDAIIGYAHRVGAVLGRGLGPFRAALAGDRACAGARGGFRQIALPLVDRVGHTLIETRCADRELTPALRGDDEALARIAIGDDGRSTLRSRNFHAHIAAIADHDDRHRPAVVARQRRFGAIGAAVEIGKEAAAATGGLTSPARWR